MKKIRISFERLSFNTRYAVSYIWTAISIVAIFLGAKFDTNYFWIVPAMCIIAWMLFADEMSRLLSTILAIDISLVIIAIATHNVSIGNILTMEIVIIILGPLFFKEHAK